MLVCQAEDDNGYIQSNTSLVTNVLCTVPPRVAAVVEEVGNECQDAKDNSGHSCNAELFSVHQWNSVNIHLCSGSVSGSCGGVNYGMHVL